MSFIEFLYKVCAATQIRKAGSSSFYSIHLRALKYNACITSCASDEAKTWNFMSSTSDFLCGILSILLKTNTCYSFWYIFDFLYFPTIITRLLKMNFNHVLYAFFIIFCLLNSFQQNGLLRNPTIELLREEKQLKALTDTENKHPWSGRAGIFDYILWLWTVGCISVTGNSRSSELCHTLQSSICCLNWSVLHSLMPPDRIWGYLMTLDSITLEKSMPEHDTHLQRMLLYLINTHSQCCNYKGLIIYTILTWLQSIHRM